MTKLNRYDCSYKGHVHKSYALRSSFSNDSAYVVSGGEEGSIFIWDLVEVYDVIRVTVAVQGSCFIEERNMNSCRICLKKAKVIQRMGQAHTRAVLSVAYHPTENTILSCGSDGLIKVWGNGS